jgi:hypothetical protein
MNAPPLVIKEHQEELSIIEKDICIFQFGVYLFSPVYKRGHKYGELVLQVGGWAWG